MGALSLQAQTNSPPVDTNATPAGFLNDLGNFLSEGTNFILIPFGTLTTGNNGKYGGGGGVALAYHLSDYVVPALRVDYLNKAFYQGALTAQLQLPLHIGQSAVVFPFVIGGVATPFGGGSDNPGTVQGIAGTGLALEFGAPGSTLSHFGLVYDMEKWSATPGLQHRIGLITKLFSW